MKILTITCHNVYNYGASLQAFALLKYISKFNHEVEIIDYKPPYLSKRYNFWHIDNTSKYYSICMRFKFLHLLYSLQHYRSRFKTIGRKKPFDQFTNEFLKRTSTCYNSNQQLRDYPPFADLYIAGSDQIWNTNYENGKDGSFFFDFLPEDKKCISYAASFGTDSIHSNYKDIIKANLSKFKEISVREMTGLSILETLGIKNAIQVLDPIFLLSKGEWNLLVRNRFTEKYILLYDFLGDDPLVREVTTKLSQKFHWKIFSINDFKNIDYADKNISDAGPVEFLEYISSAQVIVSTSFHATAFSVLFEKPFFVIGLKKHKNSSRMIDFLELVGLGHRFVDSVPAFENIEIDFYSVNERLKNKVEMSKAFLNKYIN